MSDGRHDVMASHGKELLGVARRGAVEQSQPENYAAAACVAEARRAGFSREVAAGVGVRVRFDVLVDPQVAPIGIDHTDRLLNKPWDTRSERGIDDCG